MDAPRLVIGKRYPLRGKESPDRDESKESLSPKNTPKKIPLISATEVPNSTPRKPMGPKKVWWKDICSMTREEFVKDMTVLPAKMNDGAREALVKYGWIFQGDAIRGNPLLCCVIPPQIPPQTGWRKRQTGQPERIHLVDGSGVPRGMIIYRPMGKNPEVSLEVFLNIS